MGGTDSKHSPVISEFRPLQLQHQEFGNHGKKQNLYFEKLCHGQEEEEQQLQHSLQGLRDWAAMHGLEAFRHEKESPPPSKTTHIRPPWMHFAGKESNVDDDNDDLFYAESFSEFGKAVDDEDESRRDLDDPGDTISEPENFLISSCSFPSRCNSFPRPVNKSPGKFQGDENEDEEIQVPFAPTGGEHRVVLYFTSLRAIRKTYEDCCRVRLILQGFRVFVDERDVSLHAEYRRELQRFCGLRRVDVPVLLVRGELIGGADRVVELHEEGELGKHFAGFPVQKCVSVCEGCGDFRFVVCSYCNGSCRVFDDYERVIKCPDCNENGLVRCHLCY